jgi:hypothetical protein
MPLHSPGCVLLVVVVVVRAKPTQNNTKNKNPKILSMCQYGCLSIMIMQKIAKQNQNQNQKPFSSTRYFFFL